MKLPNTYMAYPPKSEECTKLWLPDLQIVTSSKLLKAALDSTCFHADAHLSRFVLVYIAILLTNKTHYSTEHGPSV